MRRAEHSRVGVDQINELCNITASTTVYTSPTSTASIAFDNDLFNS